MAVELDRALAEILVVRLPTLTYGEGLELQRRIRDARRAGSIPDTLLLLEHWPVYTIGRRSEADELAMGADWYRLQGIEVCETDRGGRVTYHGPGQLVAYPIIDLRPYDDDIEVYVRRLERVTIDALRLHDVRAQVFDGLAGVWTAGQPPIPAGHPSPQGTPVGVPADPSATTRARKIGSIGIHVSRGITTHGIAINVNNDLQPFEWIVPCGIDYVKMSSLAREHGAEQDLGAFADALVGRFAELFEREPRRVTGEELEVAITEGASAPARTS